MNEYRHNSRVTRLSDGSRVFSHLIEIYDDTELLAGPNGAPKVIEIHVADEKTARQLAEIMTRHVVGVEIHRGTIDRVEWWYRQRGE